MLGRPAPDKASAEDTTEMGVVVKPRSTDDENVTVEAEDVALTKVGGEYVALGKVGEPPLLDTGKPEEGKAVAVRCERVCELVGRLPFVPVEAASEDDSVGTTVDDSTPVLPRGSSAEVKPTVTVEGAHDRVQEGPQTVTVEMDTWITVVV